MNSARNASGLSLIETLVGITLLGIMALSGVSINKYINLVNSKERLKTSAAMALLSVRDIIRDQQSWEITLARPENNTELRCLRNLDLPCTGGDIAGGIELWRINPDTLTDEMVYSSKVIPGQLFGFDYEGKICQGFNQKSGNDDCPFRVDLKLRLDCSPGCRFRNLNIHGQLLYSPVKTRATVNLSKEFFSENKLLRLVISDQNCQDYGGIYDPATHICNLPTSPANCPGAQILVGISNGLPICEDP